MIVFTTDNRHVAAISLPGGPPQMLITNDQVAQFVQEHRRDLWLGYTAKDKAIVKAKMWKVPVKRLLLWMERGNDPDDFSDLFKQVDWVCLNLDSMASNLDMSENVRDRLDQMVAIVEDDASGVADEIIKRLYSVADRGRDLKGILEG